MEGSFAFLNNAKKVLGDPSYEQTMRGLLRPAKAAVKMRARNTGTSIPPVVSTSPGSLPTPTPSGRAFLAVADTPHPTNKTPPGSNTGQIPSIAMPPRPSPRRPCSRSRRARIYVHLAAADSAEQPVGFRASGQALRANLVSKPPKPLLPWVLLAMFLLTAVGLLVFVLTK